MKTGQGKHCLLSLEQVAINLPYDGMFFFSENILIPTKQNGVVGLWHVTGWEDTPGSSANCREASIAHQKFINQQLQEEKQNFVIFQRTRFYAKVNLFFSKGQTWMKSMPIPHTFETAASTFTKDTSIWLLLVSWIGKLLSQQDLRYIGCQSVGWFVLWCNNPISISNNSV